MKRRDFLKISGMTSGLLLLHPFCALFEKDYSSGLLFDRDNINTLRERVKLPLFREYWEELLNADLHDDRLFLEKGIEYNNQLRHLARIDRILQREAFVFMLTEDEKRGEMARLALQQIFIFKKWDYFIEAGKDVIGLQRAPLTTQSVIFAHDWLGDFLTQKEKNIIMTQLPEKGCEPCYRSLFGMLHQDEVVGWGFDPESSFYEERDMRNWPKILSRTNLRAVPMSALGLGAIFLKDQHPRADEWLNVVKQTYDDFVDLFEPDGSYPEGTGYCRYTSEELIVFLQALKRKLKKDWSDAVNWPGVMDFLLMTRMPTKSHPYGHVNFGDGGQGFGSDIGFWVAKEYNDGVAQYAAEEQYQRHKLTSIMLYDARIKPVKPEKDWFYRHFDIGWVVLSTGFELDDFVVAMRSGGPANHENADRNSIIMKYAGENLLVDNWHPPYSHEHPAWTLRTSPAHNTVLIDGKGHQYHDGMEGTNASHAEAKVVKETVRDDYAIVWSDSTQAYSLVNDNVKSVNRAFLAMPKSRFLVVVDTLETKEDEAAFTARWFVENEDEAAKIKTRGNGFTIERPMAKLIGACAGTKGVKLEKATFPVPEEHGIYPHLDVHAKGRAKKVSIVSAMAAATREDNDSELKIERKGDIFYVTGTVGGKTIEVKISVDEVLPRISVL